MFYRKCKFPGCVQYTANRKVCTACVRLGRTLPRKKPPKRAPRRSRLAPNESRLKNQPVAVVRGRMVRKQ